MNTGFEFPKYVDGDVGVTLTMFRSYQLHSSVLRRLSTVFAEMLVDPPRLTPKARQEHLPAFRIELVGVGPRNAGYFIRKRVSESGRVIDPTEGMAALDASRHAEQHAHIWDWLFQTFYGKAPKFDESSLATLVDGCTSLVVAAESVGAVDHVREFVELALLRQDNLLWKSIASNSASWAELGLRVHSRTIFCESVTHLVGKWHTIDEALKKQMRQDIRQLCESKAEKLELAKEAIELRILGHYPNFLCRRAQDRPGRPSYANDIYMWMSVCFFRQWFAQAISEGRTRKAPDGGYEFYRMINRGGQGYLHHEDFRAFHQYFPMSSKGCNVLEANMAVLKEDVKQFVQDLLAVRVHANMEEDNINWLTCTAIEKEDLPWKVRDSPSTTGTDSDSDSELEELSDDEDDEHDDGDEDEDDIEIDNDDDDDADY